jgi:hypothetical protein
MNYKTKASVQNMETEKEYKNSELKNNTCVQPKAFLHINNTKMIR